MQQTQKATAGQLWENQKKEFLTLNGLNSECLNSPASQSTQHYFLVGKEMPVT